jgi:nucleoside-diphosphate-sugar epimerase
MSLWKGKNVVVSGGTGFIGSVLVEHLLDLGARVRVPVRAMNFRTLSKRRSEVEWVEGDLRQHEYCTSLLQGIDYVFHLASHRRNSEFHLTHSADVLIGNLEMSIAMAQALKDRENVMGATFFSSANVPPEIDVIRLAQQKTMDGYVLGKALAETLWLAAAAQYKFPLLVVRPVGAYGERDTFSVDGNVIPSLMVKAEKAKGKLEVWGSGKQERIFLYVHDLIGAVFHMIENKATGIQYVMPPHLTTIAALAEKVRDLVNPGLTLTFDKSKPEGSRSLAVLPMHPSLKDFPWTPLDEGLKKTYEGWKQKGK